MGEKNRVSVSTATAEFTPRTLSLELAEETAKPLPRRTEVGERIRDALRRWFEEEL